MQVPTTFTSAASGCLLWSVCAVSLLLPATLAADDPQIPRLAWTPRSDWLNVKDLGAAGDGKADDTVAIQKVLDSIKHDVIGVLSKVQVQMPEEMQIREELPEQEFEFKHEEFTGLGGGDVEETEPAAAEEAQQPYVRPDRKIGRNEPCPCGSGKKYKHCHGKVA